jgi:hypothetical protein
MRSCFVHLVTKNTMIKTKFKIKISEINHFKVFIMCSDNMTSDMDHLHVKRIHLVSFSYIVIEDKIL